MEITPRDILDEEIQTAKDIADLSYFNADWERHDNDVRQVKDLEAKRKQLFG